MNERKNVGPSVCVDYDYAKCDVSVQSGRVRNPNKTKLFSGVEGWEKREDTHTQWKIALILINRVDVKIQAL